MLILLCSATIERLGPFSDEYFWSCIWVLMQYVANFHTWLLELMFIEMCCAQSWIFIYLFPRSPIGLATREFATRKTLASSKRRPTFMPWRQHWGRDKAMIPHILQTPQVPEHLESHTTNEIYFCIHSFVSHVSLVFLNIEDIFYWTIDYNIKTLSWNLKQCIYSILF